MERFDLKVMLAKGDPTVEDLEARGLSVAACVEDLRHALGMDYGRPGRAYARRGKRYYVPFREHYYASEPVPELELLAERGYLRVSERLGDRAYVVTAAGREWFGNLAGVTVKEPRFP